MHLLPAVGQSPITKGMDTGRDANLSYNTLCSLPLSPINPQKKAVIVF